MHQASSLVFYPVMRILTALCLLFFSLSVSAHEQGTLNRVKAQGEIGCGVVPDRPGRSAVIDGRWQGFYVDFCRAVAVAVLQNSDGVKFVPVTAATRFTTLIEKSSQVVMVGSTWTLGREWKYQIAFPAVYYLDGQGFMVRKDSGINDLTNLDGRSVCVLENTTSHSNLKAMMRSRGYKISVMFGGNDRFFEGHCDAFTSDKFALATLRQSKTDKPQDYKILDEMISREPLSPMVRNDDAEWYSIVRSVIHAMILAEQKGISSVNVELVLKETSDQEVLNLLGEHGQLGLQLGLDQKWAYRVIKEIGNYGEVFERNLGQNTAFKIDRALNRPVSQGGIFVIPPFK